MTRLKKMGKDKSCIRRDAVAAREVQLSQMAQIYNVAVQLLLLFATK